MPILMGCYNEALLYRIIRIAISVSTGPTRKFARRSWFDLVVVVIEIARCL